MKDYKIQQLIHTPLTNHDLAKYGIDEANIILYSALDDISDIEEYLSHDKAYRIILIEYEQNSGHWVLIMRYKDTLEYFNSFGLLPSKNDFVNNDILNDALNQEELFLNELFNKEINENDFKNLVYNQQVFQSKDSNTMTCGRHCMNRLLCMIHKDMNLEDYISYMKEQKAKTGLSYDELVCYAIN